MAKKPKNNMWYGNHDRPEHMRRVTGTKTWRGFITGKDYRVYYQKQDGSTGECSSITWGEYLTKSGNFEPSQTIRKEDE